MQVETDILNANIAQFRFNSFTLDDATNGDVAYY